LSAASGDGIEELRQALTKRFRGDVVNGHLTLGPADGRLRAILFEHGAIVSENHSKDGGWELNVSLQRRDYERLRKREPHLLSTWRELPERQRKAG
jgi:GTP-binding protein HflX